VCFRLFKGEGDDELNNKVISRLLVDSKFYIVGTNIKGDFYLRVTLMNPFTRISDLRDLIKEISRIEKVVRTNKPKVSVSADSLANV
jgi:L-2,4-diaminobutyrate decarboxylase